jgi:hypothetical protein
MIFIGIIISGCAVTNEGEQDLAGKITNEALLAVDEPFMFDWYIGHALSGYDSISIDSDGGVRLVTRDPDAAAPEYRMLRFVAREDQVRSLRRRLAALEFPSLRRIYRDENVVDGTQLLVRVRVGDREEVVYCDNRFPSSIREIQGFLKGLFRDEAEEVRRSGMILGPRETWPSFATPWISRLP